MEYTAAEYFDLGRGTVTLCGSTKFFTECMEINRRLTFKGWLVFMCGSWGHSYHKDMENPNADYELVKTLHYIKILNSDAVVVVTDESGYIGDSTKAEINFCLDKGIPIFYYNGVELTGYSIEHHRIDT